MERLVCPGVTTAEARGGWFSVRSGDWLMIWSDAALQACLYLSGQTASTQVISHLGGAAIIVKIGSEFVLGCLLYASLCCGGLERFTLSKEVCAGGLNGKLLSIFNVGSFV